MLDFIAPFYYWVSTSYFELYFMKKGTFLKLSNDLLKKF